MRLFKSAIVLLALVLPAPGNGQSLGYSDADTPGEAVGMMKASLYAAELMKSECVSRFPESQPEIDENLAKWKTAEAEVLKKAELYWSAMVEKSPGVAVNLEYVETAVKKTLEILAGMPSQPGADVLSQYCRQHFSALASGIWRSRTPRAYAYMDDLPATLK